MIDEINSGFLFMASLFYAFNLKKLIEDKEVKGYSYYSIVFFSMWNFWNVFLFFKTTDFLLTQISSCLVAAINLIYLIFLFKYSRK